MASFAPADLSTREAVDVAKANLSDVYGNAARLVRQRDAALKATYDQLASTLKSNSSARTSREGAIAGKEAAGMNTAAQALGLNMPPSPATEGRAQSFRDVDRAGYEGDTAGWGSYLGKVKGIEADRNMAAANAFDYMGQEAGKDLDNDFLAMLASGGGGGGGGGWGSGGSGDEGLIEYPKYVNQMDAGAARGLAAARIRLEDQGAAWARSGVDPRTYKYKGHAKLTKSAPKKSAPKKKTAPAPYRGSGGGGLNRMYGR